MQSKQQQIANDETTLAKLTQTINDKQTSLKHQEYKTKWQQQQAKLAELEQIYNQQNHLFLAEQAGILATFWYLQIPLIRCF